MYEILFRVSPEIGGALREVISSIYELANIKMKNMEKHFKILFIMGLCILGNNLFSQVSFSCTYREYCSWNDYKQKYENCKGYEESSIFVMNQAETMFTHTTETMKSSYYVNSSEYDSEYDVYTYFVTSDVGNKYYYIFDLKNKEIRVLIKDENDNLQLLRFYVKAIF